MAKHNILGKDGEEAAANYLLRNGYNIRHRNWRSGHYELDIVAEKDDVVAFVEVKTRTDTNYRLPEEAVNMQKIRRTVRAADAYIRAYGVMLSPRFDIISIVGGSASEFKIEHIKEAFFPPLF